MNGPQHYKAAERLLSDASFTTGSGKPAFRQNGSLHEGPVAVAMIERAVAAAQVHATLALAAAQAQITIDAGFDHPDIPAAGNWHAAIETTGENA